MRGLTFAMVPMLVGTVAAFLSGADQGHRAFVLDSGAQAVVALDLSTGARLWSLPIPGNPTTMLQSPDGSRLVVLDRGPGEDKGERGYKATGKSWATIVDPVAQAVVARVELGSGVESQGWPFGAEGRGLVLLCPGYDAKNASDAQPRELVVLDLAESKVTGRLTLEPNTLPLRTTTDGRSLVLIQGLPRGERFPFPQSRVWVVDLAGPSIAGKVDAGSWTSMYTDGAHLYLLDPGKPDDNPQKNRNGAVEVISLENRAREGALDAGRAPSGLVPDEQGGQVYILSQGPPKASDGELRVIRGAALAATVKVAARPSLVQREGDALYVVGERAVTLVDPGDLRVTGTVPLTRGNDALVDDDAFATELAVSPDRKRAYLLYGVANRLVVLDVDQKRAIGSTKTGRGGKHFLRGLGKLNMLFTPGPLHYFAGLPYGYNPWAPAASRWMLAVRPDGRFAYALNMQTNDVTVVDSSTAEAVEKIAAGGYRLVALTGGNTLAVLSPSHLRLLDAATNRESADLEVSNLRGLLLSPDGSRALAGGDGVLVLLDGTSGKVLARLTDFVKPDVVLFDGASARP